MNRMKKTILTLSSLLLFTCSAALSLTTSAAEDKGVNLCRDGLDPKTAYSFSGGSDPARRAFDGKTSTWCTAAYDVEVWGNQDTWVQCDFGKEQWIGRYIVKPCIAFESDSFAVTKFQFKVSLDGKTWTQVDAVDSDKAQVEDRTIEPVKARYIRLYAENCKGDEYVRFAEIEVYAGTPKATTTVGKTTADKATTTDGRKTTPTDKTTAAAGSTTTGEGLVTTDAVVSEPTATSSAESAPAPLAETTRMTNASDTDDTDAAQSGGRAWIPIVIVSVIILAGGVAAVLVILKKKGILFSNGQ